MCPLLAHHHPLLRSLFSALQRLSDKHLVYQEVGTLVYVTTGQASHQLRQVYASSHQPAASVPQPILLLAARCQAPPLSHSMFVTSIVKDSHRRHFNLVLKA